MPLSGSLCFPDRSYLAVAVRTQVFGQADGQAVSLFYFMEGETRLSGSLCFPRPFCFALHTLCHAVRRRAVGQADGQAVAFYVNILAFHDRQAR